MIYCVVGTKGQIVISNTINRNARRFPAEVLKALIQGTETFLETLRASGFEIYSGGGETADVGDLVQTVTIDSCAVAQLSRKEVICAKNITPQLAIVGLASFGKSDYETFENSGIGSNGLTSARHDLLSAYYKEKYPETCDFQTPDELLYSGSYRLNDPLPSTQQTIGEALLSPTRTYAPLIQSLLKEHPKRIKAFIHCSGGGQTKCLKFSQNIHFIKENFFPILPIFKLIQDESQTSWKEMYTVYNMGHRMEVYCEPQAVDAIIAQAQAFGIPAQQVGETSVSQDPQGRNSLTLKHQENTFTYLI